MTRAQARWLHTLYLTYAETLYRLARWRLGDPVRAQDLTHNVFLAAAGKLSQLQDHPNPLGWLLRAMQYELSHEFARRDKAPLPLEALPPGAAVPPPAPGLADLLPVGLSPRDREILLLYYDQGLSYQQIAARLDIPLSTCGTWLARARARCRRLLEQDPHFP